MVIATRRAVLAGAVFAAASLARADAPPAAAAPCSSAHYHDFDFWLGDWDVTNPEGKPVGENHVVAAQGHCAFTEDWHGKGGVTGTSLNAWDADFARWRQFWVDVQGGTAVLEGGLRDGSMVLEGDSFDRDKSTKGRNRITWTPLPDGRVRQWWQQSSDGGATWTTAFDGYYSRRR
jgi:hypothetical protein